MPTRLLWSFLVLLGCLSLAACGSNTSGSIQPAAAQLSASFLSFNFGNVNVGASQSQTITFTASGGSVTVNSASVSPATAFSVSGISFPVTVQEGQSVSATVTFMPQVAGPASASIAVVSTASSQPMSISVSGTGSEAAVVAQLLVSPVSLTFSNVNPGSTSPAQPVTLTANAGDVTVSAPIVPAGFSVAGQNFPVTIPAGQSAIVSVSFTPQSSTPASGAILFPSSATNSPTTVSLAATVAPNFTIAGTLSSAAAGATVTLSGAAGTVTMADSNGNFSFTGLVNGSYTITPSKQGIAFSPANQAVVVSGNDVTSVNFAELWTLSGNLGPSGAGAAVNLTGASTASTVADSGGNFTFFELLNGAYTITPSKTGIAFSPASLPTFVNGANLTGVNFGELWSISGTLSAAAAGATIALSGAANAVTTADASGNYSFSSLPNGRYTVAPSKVGLTFTPATLVVTISGGGTNMANFGELWTISGTLGVAGAGAGVNLSGAATTSILADSSGNFSFSGLPNGAYTVTPVKNGITFAQPVLPVIVNGANLTGIVFGELWTISGTLGLSGAGASVKLAGSSLPDVIAGPDGSYLFTDVPAGSFAVMPMKPQIVFTPATQPVSLTDASLNGIDFSVMTFLISGTVTSAASSASVALSGAQSATITPDSSGGYSFSVILNGSYVVTPTETDVTFGPLSQAVALNGANAGGVDFTAAVTHTTGLSWDASSSLVSGYNVYQATISGGPYTLLNSSLVTGLTFTDTTVQIGATYFYIVTAMDANGIESVPSDEVSVLIPTLP